MKLIIEESFNNRILKMYSKWMFTDIIIADGGMILCMLVVLILGLWQLLPFIIIPCGYMLTLGSPSKPIMHFIETYMDVGESPSADKLFTKKVEPRFGGFGSWSPWKDFDAVFV